MNTRLRDIAVLFVLLGFLLVFSATGFAQGIVTGSISGTVHDPQRAVVPGATVTAVQSDTSSTFKTKTNGEGYFLIANLPIGRYTLTIEAVNFKEFKVSNVDVNSGHDTNVGSQVLAIGTKTETVEVTAAAPLIETVSAQIGGTFDTTKVADLPNPGNGFDSLTLYIPGMAQVSGSNFSNTNGAGLTSNGLRGRSNNFQIDGQANNDNSVAGPSIFLSNPDIISELQVVTNNFGAEYGRNTGSIVNYVTKSGSNSFHGSAYNYYTGNYSFSRSNEEKNPIQGFCATGVAPSPGGCTASVVTRYVENRSGGTLGGPIWRNKAWFFGSYQSDRSRTGAAPSSSSSILPTPAGITALAAAFPGNPAVAALQKIGPYAVAAGNPSASGAVQIVPVTVGATTVSVPFSTFSRFVPALANDHQVTGRGDWQISENDRFFARYVFQKSFTSDAAGDNPTGGYVDIPAKDQQIGLDYTRTWTSRFLQQYRLSYSRAGFGFEGGGFANCTQANIFACPTRINFNDGVTNFFGIANNLPQGRLVNNTQYQNNSTYMIGKHQLKFGGEYGRQRSPNVFLPNINGTYTFADFNAFMQGNAAALTLADGPKSFPFKEQDLSFYGQDDWRLRENLTLQLGLRWEWYQQAVNLLHDLTVANQAQNPPFWSTSAPANTVVIPTIPEALHNFEPNIGFAYTPRIFPGILGGDKTVIRGGYRIAYDPAFYNIFLNIATAAPVVNLGTVTAVGLPGSGATGTDVRNAFLGLIPRGANPGFRNQSRVSNDFHNPYTQQWSLSVERQIGAHLGVETRYVGNHTVGNFETINGNPLITGIPAALLPSGVTPCATPGAPGVGHVDCNFSNLRVRNNGAFSIYHGIQNRLDVKNWHGFTTGLGYTFSKAIDNVSEIFAADGGISTPVAQNPFNVTNGERGVAAQSYPHVFTSYWIYDLPWRNSQQGWFGHVLGGWQWSGTYRYQTGAPITPYQSTQNGACDTGFNNAFIGRDSCRPILSNPGAPFDAVGRYTSATNLINVSTLAPTTPSAVHFIANNAFADAALCGGNPFACTVSRNTFRAQDRNNLDMSIMKSTKLTERIQMQLRADLFNALNYMYLGTPGLNVNSKNINGLTATGKPAPGSFGNTAFKTSTTNGVIGRRFIQLQAHFTF